ncbi:MAG: hypothetical protein NTY80_01300 [candidate division SR1 bacterium]|nr:hypothetical protein [candidate division SR1 bacterium]
MHTIDLRIHEHGVQGPSVATGYISAGITGTNGGNLYYKGTISIRSEVSDGFGGLNGSTCVYSTGIGWASATYQTTYCEVTSLAYTSDLTIRFRISDNAGNITTGGAATYLYDNSGPSMVTALSPSSGQALNTGNINLMRSGGVDTGVGLSGGYVWQISTGNTFAHILNSGSAFVTGASISSLSTGTYYRRISAYDRFGNVGAWSSGSVFTIDIVTVSFAIAGPASLSIGSLPTPESTIKVAKIFTGANDYFTIADYIGDDAGYYTTLSMGNMSNQSGNILSNNNIAVKTATGVITLSGSSNPNVVSGITGSYTTFGNSVLTFIQRNAGANGGLTGTYAISPAIEITVPELQSVGNYSGTMIYTLYPN